jgi:hypothetical protein
MKTWIQKSFFNNTDVNSDDPMNNGKYEWYIASENQYQEDKKMPKEKFFIKYPGIIECGGKRRIFISESGLNPFFEIFIWDDNSQKMRMDFYYSIHENEHLLSWNKNSGFVHLSVNPEREDFYGNKKIQTISDQIAFNWPAIRENYIERMNATYGIFENKIVTSINAYKDMKEILEFILKLIDGKYYQ